jgi:hypothetical protein
MKRFLRSQLEQRAPAVFNGLRALRHRRYFRRQFAQLHAEIREQLFPRGAPIAVQSGPFRGMRYFDETVWGSITPKWLGSYEAELHPVTEHIAQRAYATIIDVGCAEGYYAVGLAITNPTTRITAFDTDFISRRQVRRLAALNQVADRIQIGSFCHHSDLDTLSRSDTLVVCDIEGFEVQLLSYSTLNSPPPFSTTISSSRFTRLRRPPKPSSTFCNPALRVRTRCNASLRPIVRCGSTQIANTSRRPFPMTCSEKRRRRTGPQDAFGYGCKPNGPNQALP